MENYRKKNRKKQSRWNRLLELPEEVVSTKPRLTIVGFEELLIENYKSILEYEEFFIRICTHIGNININGFELNLNQITDDDVKITGKIENIDFECR